MNRNFNFFCILCMVLGLSLDSTALLGQDIIHPTSGTNTISIASGDTRNYYDSGGAGCDDGSDGIGEYSDDETGITVLCPSSPGEVITLEFLEVDTETRSTASGCWDEMFIYNGSSTSSPLLFQGCGEEGFASCPGGFPGDGDDCAGQEGGPCDMDGTNAPNPANNMFTSTATDGCLTVFFDSDGVIQEGGWVATVSSAGTAPTCSITGLTLTNLRCGDGFNSDDAYADVSFAVAGGSGNYSVQVRPAGGTSSTNGNSILNAITDGMINSSVQLTVGSVAGGDMAEVFIIDTQTGGCVSNVVTVTVPQCPPCPAAGGLVITEIMQNPSAVFDSNGEWFEVYNAGSTQINMKNMVISDNNASHTIATDLLVNPGQYVVLARNANTMTNGGVVAAYEYGGTIQLGNGSDEIVLTCQGVEIDRVAYDGGPGFPDPNGASMQLDPGSNNAGANDAGANWCEATATYGNGDKGTPGTANTACCSVEITGTTPGDVSCAGGSDGTLTITATGATTYTYSIDGPGGMQSNSTGSFSGLMAGSYTIMVNDASNASCNDTGSASVGTAVDTEAPTAVCPGDITTNNNPGDCSAIVTFAVSANDNCPGATATADPASGSFFPVGTTTVTVTATDAAGNPSTCTFDVTVNDTEAPAAVCPGDITTNNDPGDCGAIVTFVVGANDNCPGATATADPASGSFFPVGTTTVTVTATDAAGTPSTCTFDVTVNDTEAPMITTCDGGTMVFNGEESFNTEDYINLVLMDNCTTPTITYDPEMITCDQAGTTVSVMITATDAAGNPSTCVADVEVGGLPCGWMDTGGIGCTGGSGFDGLSGDFTVTSTGCVSEYPYVSDQNGFIYQELCGDGSITALITGVTPGSGYPGNFAGVMMRETADPGSKLIAMGHNGNTFGQRRYRVLDNYPSFPQFFYNLDKFWVKIERTGYMFRGYISADGQNWIPYMFQAIQMEDCIQAGLYADGANNSATFSNVMVESLGGQLLGQMPDLTEDVLDVNRGEFPAAVSVYPNPTSGMLTVELAQFQDQDVELSILNANGQEQRSFKLGRIDYATERVDLGDLPVGVYFLRVHTTGQLPVTKRIVVQRP